MSLDRQQGIYPIQHKKKLHKPFANTCQKFSKFEQKLQAKICKYLNHIEKKGELLIIINSVLLFIHSLHSKKSFSHVASKRFFVFLSFNISMGSSNEPKLIVPSSIYFYYSFPCLQIIFKIP